jgi:hypothetical protein
LARHSSPENVGDRLNVRFYVGALACFHAVYGFDAVVATCWSGVKWIRAIRPLRPRSALLAMAIQGLNAREAPRRGMP